MLYAFARDGFLPARLAAVHPTFRSPHLAIAIQSALTVALAVSGTFEKLAIFANVSALALYFGCALAAWRLRTLGVAAEGAAPFRVPLAPVVPWLACAVILWLLTGLNRDEWLGFVACLALGTTVYFATRASRRARVSQDPDKVLS
jgi:amino acid transporter